MGRSSLSVATPSPPLLSVRLLGTSRRSCAMSPLTSSRRCPPLLPPPPWRSPMSFPMPGHHHWQRALQVPRGPLPALFPGHGGLWHPRDHLQLHHEVRCWYQEGPVCQHCHVWWHHHVPRYRRQDAEGDHCPRPQHHQDQDHCSPREEVLRLDRWLYPCLPFHLPADVDLQAGVRRVRTLHCPPQVLLNVCCFTVVLSSSHVLPSYVTTLYLYNNGLKSLMKQLLVVYVSGFNYIIVLFNMFRLIHIPSNSRNV